MTPRMKKELELVKNNFEALDAQLKEELPKFIELGSQLLRRY